MTKTQKILKIVNQFESEGKGFFSRVDKDMFIYIRGAHGNDPNQWTNARTLQDSLGVFGRDIQPDPQSSHLVMHLKNIYTK